MQMHSNTHTHTNTQHKHRCTLCTQTRPYSLSILTQTESFITTSKSFCFTVSPHMHHTLQSQPTVCVSGRYVCSCVFVWTGCCNQLHILTLLIDLTSATKRMFFEFVQKYIKTRSSNFSQNSTRDVILCRDTASLFTEVKGLTVKYYQAEWDIYLVQLDEHPLASSRTHSRH